MSNKPLINKALFLGGYVRGGLVDLSIGAWMGFFCCSKDQLGPSNGRMNEPV